MENILTRETTCCGETMKVYSIDGVFWFSDRKQLWTAQKRRSELRRDLQATWRGTYRREKRAREGKAQPRRKAPARRYESRLSPKAVAEMCRLRSANRREWTCTRLAEKFGVTFQYVSKIVRAGARTFEPTETEAKAGTNGVQPGDGTLYHEGGPT